MVVMADAQGMTWQSLVSGLSPENRAALASALADVAVDDGQPLQSWLRHWLTIAELLGHSTYLMSRRYRSRGNRDALRAALAKTYTLLAPAASSDSRGMN
jgi:hypothetical protein